MALIHCPECDREISDRAKACPGCGFPIEDYLQECEEWENGTQTEPEPACPVCGTVLDLENLSEGACPQCGFPVLDYLQEGGEIAAAPQAPEPIAQGPRCPVCGSRDLAPISAGKTTAKLLVLGVLAAGDAGKHWQCRDCGSKF